MKPMPPSDDDTFGVDENLAATDPQAPDADESNDFDQVSPASADDDAAWDVFLADDDERDPLPEEGDFWDDSSLDD
jgi:hypothetical protein